MIKKIIFYTCVTLIFVTKNFVQGRLTDLVETEKGLVQGEIVATIQNKSIEYSAFRRIPFAKPPVDELRFQPPVEPDAWSGILNVTKEAPSCPQINEHTGNYDGDENCLYLNVYSPKLKFNESKNELLAVMVWIYGGSFTSGSIKSETYGPDFLIAENVVIVAMNYRLGALGFLSLDIDGATGNMGLKDQVFALKWVQKNIKKFGGDPNKVIIFGESAGSVSVTLHQLSPASTEFRGAIAMSGSALSPWGFTQTSSAVKQAIEFSKYLGIFNLNKTQILDQLRKIPAEQLIQASIKQSNYVQINTTGISFLTFMPTIENPTIAKDIFLSECPLNIYQAKNYSVIPMILGFTSFETLLFTSGGFNIFSYFAKLSKNYLNLLDLENSTFVNDLNAIINDPKKDLKYLSNDVIFKAVNITSDLHFNVGIDSMQKYLTTNSDSPIYYYRNSFDYEESRHRLAGINFEGCSHADDLAHVFWQPLYNQSRDLNSQIGIHRTRIARLWTNFAKYLNPTPNNTTDPLLNFNWKPSGPEGQHLEIGKNKLTMEPRLFTDTIEAVQATVNPFEHASCANFIKF